MPDYTTNESGDVRMKEAGRQETKTFEEPRTGDWGGGLLALAALIISPKPDN